MLQATAEEDKSWNMFFVLSQWQVLLVQPHSSCLQYDNCCFTLARYKTSKFLLRGTSEFVMTLNCCGF